MRNGHLNRDGAIQNKVRLFLEDGSAYPLEGTLKFRDVTVDPTTGSVILRMVFPNTERILLPEMFVRAVITEGINEHAFLVPQQSVTRDRKGNPYALIVSPEGKVVMRMLTIERAIGNKWLVTSGLVAGDRVIIEGLQYVRPGMHVKVVPIGRSRGHGSGPGTKDKPALKKRPGGGT
jgi:membrane fusion protein (multidrug efflux system)